MQPVCGLLKKQVFPKAPAKPLLLQENRSSMGLRTDKEDNEDDKSDREGKAFRWYKIPLLAMPSHLPTLM